MWYVCIDVLMYWCIDVLMYWYQRLVRCRCSESIHPSVVLDRIIAPLDFSTVSTEVEIFVRKQTAILLFGSVLARGRYQNPILSIAVIHKSVGSWNSWLWWDYYVRLWWAPCIAYFLYDDVDVLSVGCNKTFHVPVWRHPFGTVRKIIKHPTVQYSKCTFKLGLTHSLLYLLRSRGWRHGKYV